MVLKPELEALGLGRGFSSSLAFGVPSLATGLGPHSHAPWSGWMARSSHYGPAWRPGHHHCVPRGSLQPCMQSRPSPALQRLCLHPILPGPSHGLSPGPTGLGSLSPSLPLRPPGKRTEEGLGIWTPRCDPTWTPVTLCTPAPTSKLMLWRKWSLGFSDLGGLPGGSGPTRTWTGSKWE